jgi:hypothetical protein
VSLSAFILGWAEGKETSVGVWYPVQNKDFIYLGHRISGKITTLSTGNCNLCKSLTS